MVIPKLSPGRKIVLNTEWYLICEFIESGHFASVYKVLKLSTNEDLVLKFMEPELIESHFKSEIKCMNAVILLVY